MFIQTKIIIFVLKTKSYYICKNNKRLAQMLKKFRILFAVLLWTGITLLLLDFTGTLHLWLGWMARIQFLPAVMAANVGVILFLVLLTLLFGRVYCSVICPLGVFQDGVAALHHRPRKNRRPYHFKKENKWLRYGIWALWVVLLLVGVQALAAILAPYSAWGRIVQSIFQPVVLWVNNHLAAAAERAGSYAFYERAVWLRSLPTLIVAAVTLVVVTVLAWRGGRDYCNNVCPVGTTLGFLSRFAMFRPMLDKDKCKNCKACERACKASCIDLGSHSIDHSRCVSCFNCIETCRFGALKYRFAWKSAGRTESGPDEGRRAFLTGTALVIGAAAVKAQEKKTDGGFAPIKDKTVPEREVPVTPPGSRNVKDFYRRCTACQLCVAQCPNNVLRPSSDLNHFMQPEMSFERGYCRPECTTCSEICPSGAIRPITKEEKTRYHVGTARVNRSLCVAENGTSCGNCARHCPVGAIAMVQDPERGVSVPSVDPALCIGCGACENLCPSRPVSAITVCGRYEHLSDQ